MRKNKNTIIFVYGLSLIALGYFGFVWLQYVLKDPNNLLARFGFGTIVVVALYVLYRLFYEVGSNDSEE